jgi:hypothetical protein
MSKTVEQGKAEIVALCDYFAKNREAFHAPGVKEAHVRQSLIDPFFEALGWNVANNPPVAPQYREVIPEDSIDVEGQQKAPDYTFRVGTLPKFYVEAKKCGVNISADPGPAYQLRRYGWSAKVALSILTDFEELAVYDCTIRPRPGDKAGHARIHYFRFDEYSDRWRELWDIYSREAVWSGAFDQYVASKRKRGTSEVDEEFLKEIEGWRDELARNIALRNRGLSSDDLNRAVQLTIDRLIFLRMAEDRGLESYAQLLALCSRPGIYGRFMADLCRKADDKYNSGLFHFQEEDGVSEDPDRITPGLAVDDAVLRPILQRLYFEHGSPYHFGVLPVEILGTVYERFLGKVIRLTADHHAKVEEKPEVRKAGGVYYTPKYIVDYIVRQTVGRRIEGKSPAQLAGGKGAAQKPFRVLDMACGSGSFLLGAYQCLLDHCLKWYAEHRPQGHKKAVYMDRRTGWRLTVDEKKRILTTHIFGVDIDPQAVEVSKLSLLLKVLEGETAQSLQMGLLAFKDRALPNLAENIKCGNSLIGPDYFSGRLIPDPEELARVNAFDWQREFPAATRAGGFDCVIGNPPYSSKQSIEYQMITRFFSCVEYKCDPYAFFVEQGLRNLRKGGRLGYIIPVTWMTNFYYAKLRRHLIESQSLAKVVLVDGLVFKDANVDTSLLFLAKESVNERRFEWLRAKPDELNSTSVWRSYKWIEAEERFDITPEADPQWMKIKAKVDKASVQLNTLGKISLGMKLRSNAEFIVTSKDTAHPDPIWFGDDISRYDALRPSRYFNAKKAVIIGGTKNPTIHKTHPKILIQAIRNLSLQRRIVATQEEQGFHFVGTVNAFTQQDNNCDIRYILGILNSTLLNTYFRKRFTTISLTAAFLGILPIRRMDFAVHADKAAHDRMVSLVDSMLALHKQAASSKSEAQRGAIERQIEATDTEIDRLVYDLYGLTKDEIAIVEEGRA